MSARTAGWLLWLLTGGLAVAAVIWQLAHPPRPAVAVDAARRPPELPAVAPVQPFQLPPLDQYGEIVAHPLFVAARQPEPPPPEEAAPEKPTAGPEQKPVLIGIMIAPESTVALLRPEEPNAKVARVKPGESVGDWRLEAILPNRVVLRKGQTIQELALERPKRPVRPKTPPRAPVRPAGDAVAPASIPAPPPPEAPPPVIPAPPQ
ncbi:MAG: hypothetical protein RKR03_01495 [Candidatus Competibacter sp.]|nr:hypothetical protein [Candidatus Competibacter sp.]